MASRKATSVQVIVRVRPENQREIEGGFRNVVRVVDDHVICFDPDDSFGTRRVTIPGSRRPKDSKFAFDRVFDCNATQREVYEATAKPLINDVFQGYNATVFAYGATGAGKTHTMLGNEKAGPGVMVFCIQDLFDLVQQNSEETEFKLSLTYLEVYNETLRDLLNPTNKDPLDIREDSLRGIIVSNLSTHYPTNTSQVLELLQEGNNNRSQCPTDANATSSRSHAVLQLSVESQCKASGTMSNKRIGKLSLIDLAGSERASRTKNKGARLAEGASINKSLLALGSCINELVKGKSTSHVPYRNSKLTRLLKDSLGGNCRTVMISNISPSFDSFEDTHNTLKYANRAKNIRVLPKANIRSVAKHVSEYVATLKEQTRLINKQKEEIEKLKKELKNNSSRVVDTVKKELEVANLYKKKLSGLFVKVDDHYRKKESLRRRKKEIEKELTSLDFVLGLDDGTDKPSVCYAKKVIPELRSELEELTSQIKHHQGEYQSFTREVQSVTSQIRSKINNNNELVQFVEDFTKKKLQQVELDELRSVRSSLQKEVENGNSNLLLSEKDSKSIIKFFVSVLTDQAKALGLLEGQNPDLMTSFSTAVKIGDVALTEGISQAASILDPSKTIESTPVGKRDPPKYPATPFTPGPLHRVFKETEALSPKGLSDEGDVEVIDFDNVDTVTNDDVSNDHQARLLETNQWAEKVSKVQNKLDTSRDFLKKPNPTQKPKKPFRRRPPGGAVKVSLADQKKPHKETIRKSMPPRVDSQKPAVKPPSKVNKADENSRLFPKKNVGMDTLKNKFSELENMMGNIKGIPQVKFSLDELK
ncbi:hypothetical protein P9112_004635 [Eukaryota sp. TZLM1-RC]